MSKVHTNWKEIYEKVYKKNSKYGSHFHGKDAIDFIVAELKPQSVLDAGCGGNEFCKHIRSHGIFSVGVDFASVDCDVIADIKQIPVRNKSYDIVTAFDVLEHIEEKDLDLVLQEFSRISIRYLFFSIAYRPSHKNIDGKNLHPTVRKERWWMNRMNKYIIVRKYKQYIWGELL